MNKNLFFSFLTVMLATFVMWSCQRHVDKPGQSTGGVVLVQASIHGRVIDENEVPVEDAVIKAGNAVTTTDVNGNFTINAVELDKDKGFVTVDKEGYFTGSRTFVVSTAASNTVQVQLIREESSGNFSAGSGGSVTIPSGGNITFASNGVMDPATKSAYSGTVEVVAVHLDPTDPDFTAMMPADLRGVNVKNEENGLRSFGVLAVELHDTNGEKLQLETGKTATLSFPIATALQSEAPSTVTLSYLDESKGIWVEEGTATRQGNNYVGTVSHFSFWNVNAPYQLVNFNAMLKDNQGKAVANALVVITSTIDTVTVCGSGYSDLTGRVEGKVPANRLLKLNVYNHCRDLIKTMEIGPFANEASLGNITVSLQPAFVTFSGTVMNCSNQPVANGYVNILIDGRNQRAVINNGSFNLKIERCSNFSTTARVIAVDQSVNAQGQEIPMFVNEGSINLGQLTACGTSTAEYFNFLLDNNRSFSFGNSGDVLSHTVNNSQQTVTAYRSTDTSFNRISLSFTGDSTAGSHTVTFAGVQLNYIQYKNTQNFESDITEFGPVNGFISGSFSTILADSTNASITVPVSGTFRIKRTK